MPTLQLKIQEIATLKNIEKKLLNRKSLSAVDKNAILTFLSGIPKLEVLLSEKVRLEQTFEFDILNFDEMQEHGEKWITLFNSLPKNGSQFYPNASWVDEDNDENFWKSNVIITGSFVPSYAYSKKKAGHQTIEFHLKADGTAYFEFLYLNDAKRFPELYEFNGSWKEAYLLVTKTLLQGWPQTKFPDELQQFLKK